MPKKKARTNSKSKPKPRAKLKSKAKSLQLKKIEIDLTVRSEHPSLPAPAAVEQIRRFAPELSERLKAKYGEGTVEVDRQKTFPADPATILVTIGIFVGLKIAEALIAKITEDVYHWVREKLTAADVTKVGRHRTKPAKRR